MKENISKEEAVGEEGKEKKNQATVLVNLCDGAIFFNDSDGTAYVTIGIDGTFRTWPVRSSELRSWLCRQYFARHGRTASSQPLQDAIGTLEGKGLFEGPTRDVKVRIFDEGDRIFLDLGNDKWEAVSITKSGWSIVPNDSRFRRPSGMRPLPTPTQMGDFKVLKHFVNLADEADWRLLVGFILGTFRGHGPFPILSLQGEQGSAKSTTARLIRSVIDPNAAPLRAIPKTVEDLMIAARNGWLLVFDNLSHIPEWMSDAFCRLATGGGFSTRKLYENHGEVLFDSVRPVILNGIEEFIVRSDLADRAILLNLPTIKPKRRKTEEQLRESWEIGLPLILGGFCNLCSMALKSSETLVLSDLPRMADFVRWVSAAHVTLGWEKETFRDDLQQNRDQNHRSILDSSLITPFIQDLAKEGWSGTPTNLFERAKATLDIQYGQGFPRTPKGMSDHLRRLVPNFRAIGITVTFSRSTARNIDIRFSPISSGGSDGCDVADDAVADVEEKTTNSQLDEYAREERAAIQGEPRV